MSTTTPPAAVRAAKPGWRDPRILIGIAIVAASVLLGARLLGSADDTVGVLAVRADLPAGADVDEGALEVRQIRFADAVDADRYLSASDGVPKEARLTRAVGAGELLPRAALDTSSEAPLVEVPISVGSDDLPATVRQGSVVDVWVGADGVVGAVAKGARATKVLDDVVVVALPGREDSLAPEATRQLIVGLDETKSGDLAKAVGQISTGRVVITRQAD